MELNEDTNSNKQQNKTATEGNFPNAFLPPDNSTQKIELDLPMIKKIG